MSVYEDENKGKKKSTYNNLSENDLSFKATGEEIKGNSNLNEEIMHSNNEFNLTHNEFKDELKEQIVVKNPRKKKEIEYIEEGDYSSKTWSVTLVLCILLGFIGFHRFYVGKAGTAILMLLTFGGFGIWVLVDLIRIIINNFTDEEGKIVKRTSLAI